MPCLWNLQSERCRILHVLRYGTSGGRGRKRFTQGPVEETEDQEEKEEKEGEEPETEVEEETEEPQEETKEETAPEQDAEQEVWDACAQKEDGDEE